jgi:hypothetical protein
MLHLPILQTSWGEGVIKLAPDLTISKLFHSIQHSANLRTWLSCPGNDCTEYELAMTACKNNKCDEQNNLVA